MKKFCFFIITGLFLISCTNNLSSLVSKNDAESTKEEKYISNEADTSNNKSILDPSKIDLSSFLKPNFIHFSELMSKNEDCLYLSKDSIPFSGTAYVLESSSDYYFLNGMLADSLIVRLKIIEFKNGVKDGVSKIIDPINNNPENNSEAEKTIEFNETKKVMEYSAAPKKLIFWFNDYNITYGDLSEYIDFNDYAFYSDDGEELESVELSVLGDDWDMAELAHDKYRGKYLQLTIVGKYGKSGEQFGHYESDYQLFYNSVPPYYCGENINIVNIEVLENFVPKN